LKNSAAGPPFALRVEPGAPPAAAAQVNNLLSELFQIQLPAGSTNVTLGTDNPTLVVAVNFLGQYFCENQIVGERELRTKFTNSLRAAARQSRDLTLVVWADKQVDFDAVMRLEQWAAEAGIADVVQARRMAAPVPGAARPAP
jgi:biopolymer transport protein ExbD